MKLRHRRHPEHLILDFCGETLPLDYYPNVHTMSARKMGSAMDFEVSGAGAESYILCADCGIVISSANGAGLCESKRFLRHD